MRKSLDTWYVDNLVCPVGGDRLMVSGSHLVSEAGLRYPIVEGIPVMLVDGTGSDFDACRMSLDVAHRVVNGALDGDAWFVDTIGIARPEQAALGRSIRARSCSIDPVVSYLVGATNGNAYNHLKGRLSVYPIPTLPLLGGQGKTLLDVGCSWGRWCVAAARVGYEPVGIDPSLGAVLAARRVAKELDVKARFVVADARYLPFRPGHFDVGFSYSVIQHFSRPDAVRAIAELGRVVKQSGIVKVQMPNRWGALALWHQSRRLFRDGESFDVRYWSLPSLRRVFEDAIGPSRISIDCLIGLGLQHTDLHLMPPVIRFGARASMVFSRIAMQLPFLTSVADSVFVSSVKQAGRVAFVRTRVG